MVNHNLEHYWKKTETKMFFCRLKQKVYKKGGFLQLNEDLRNEEGWKFSYVKYKTFGRNSYSLLKIMEL